MLQQFRDHLKGWIASIIVVALCLGFALWGIQYYIDTLSHSPYVAKVNGHAITAQQLNNAYQRFRQQQTSTQHRAPALTPAAQIELRRALLQELVRTRALADAARNQGMSLSLDQVKQVLNEIPLFQQQGHFSSDRFRQVVAALNYTPEAFVDHLKEALLINQVRAGILNSDFTTPLEVERSIKLIEQTRSFDTLIIPVKSFDSIKVPESELRAFYQSHQRAFFTPERVSIRYVLLTPTIMKQRGEMQEVFSNAQDRMTELAYTHADSLKAVADTLQLPIHKTVLFTQNEKKSGILSQTSVVQAAFSPIVLQQKLNSPVLVLHDNSLLVLRLNQHQPAAPRPFLEVKSEILKQLQKLRAQAKARQQAKQFIAQLRAGKTLSALAKTHKLVTHRYTHISRHNQTLDGLLKQAVFSMAAPQSGQPSYADFALSDTHHTVVVLKHLSLGSMKTMNARKKATFQSALSDSLGRLAYHLYARDAISQAKVTFSRH